MPINPQTFLTVEGLLRDIGLGLGTASAEMYASSSNNPVGALAIKTADVTVTFELTSSTTKQDDKLGVDIPVLGAKTLSYGSQTFSESEINRLEIKLHVVTVLPPKEEQEKLEQASGEWQQIKNPQEVGKGTTGVETKPKDETAYAAARLTKALRALKAQLPGIKLSKAERKEVEKALQSIESLLAAGRIKAAASAFAEFVAKYTPETN